MIWFSCKQCGKVQSRPESSSGTMVFCTCGQGTMVPWESTAAPPPVSAGSAVPPPLPPKVGPIRFEAPPPLPPSSYPSRPARGRRRYKPAPRDPNYCFNHEGKAKVGPCADCGEGFCRNCLVDFGGKRLCGPCKNQRLRLAQRLPRTSNLAVLSLFLAFAVAGMYLFPLRHIGLSIVFGLESVALALSVVALVQTERNPQIAGQGLAWTGVFTATITCLFTVLQFVNLPRGLT
jgi:hypothetical protein